MSSIPEKTTTPIPSLNSDSPSIFMLKLLAILAFLRIAITAIGSVGEMSAPKRRACTKGRSNEKP